MVNDATVEKEPGTHTSAVSPTTAWPKPVANPGAHSMVCRVTNYASRRSAGGTSPVILSDVILATLYVATRGSTGVRFGQDLGDVCVQDDTIEIKAKRPCM